MVSSELEIQDLCGGMGSRLPPSSDREAELLQGYLCSRDRRAQWFFQGCLLISADAPSLTLPLSPFPPNRPLPQSKPVFPSQSLNQSDVPPFPHLTR